MGMYTEIIFGARLKKDTPISVIQTIKELIKITHSPKINFTNQPEHPFFDCPRTWLLQSGGSYCFSGTVSPKFIYDNIRASWSLHFRTNIKNYDAEIEKFLDWIKPYIESGSGSRNFYAIVTYEEYETPTIYYLT